MISKRGVYIIKLSCFATTFERDCIVHFNRKHTNIFDQDVSFYFQHCFATDDCSLLFSNHMHFYETFDLRLPLKWNDTEFNMNFSQSEEIVRCIRQQRWWWTVGKFIVDNIKFYEVFYSEIFYITKQKTFHSRLCSFCWKTFALVSISTNWKLESPDILTLLLALFLLLSPTHRETLFTMFPPLNEWQDEILFEKYLHGNASERHNSSGETAAVILFFALPISIPSFCLHKTVSSTFACPCPQFLAQTSKLYLLFFIGSVFGQDTVAILSSSDALCMKLWTNNWISTKPSLTLNIVDDMVTVDDIISFFSVDVDCVENLVPCFEMCSV